MTVHGEIDVVIVKRVRCRAVDERRLRGRYSGWMADQACDRGCPFFKGFIAQQTRERFARTGKGDRNKIE